MALTLVVEDGTGKSDANSYSSVADADSYNDAHVSQTAWTALSTAHKERALAHATRVLDESFQFNGFRKSESQALQWPRRDAKDPDADRSVFPRTLAVRANEFDENSVPTLVRDATIELARQLGTTGDSNGPNDFVGGFHEGAGIKRVSMDGCIDVEFDKTDIKSTIPRHIKRQLSKVGYFIGGGMVKLERA